MKPRPGPRPGSCAASLTPLGNGIQKSPSPGSPEGESSSWLFLGAHDISVGFQQTLPHRHGQAMENSQDKKIADFKRGDGSSPQLDHTQWYGKVY